MVTKPARITPVYDNGNTSMLAAKLIQNFIASNEQKSKT